MKVLANHPQFFPFAYRYPSLGGDFHTAVEFEYISPLQPDQSTCITFLAKTRGESTKEVVVKFFQRYSAEVHRVLTAADMAPHLLYYGQIDPEIAFGMWKMVVMEYFNGKPLHDGDCHRDFDVSEKVFRAITAVHLVGYVHGDVHPPNVLIGRENQVMLIDFDWAGKEGNVRYPIPLCHAGDWQLN